MSHNPTETHCPKCDVQLIHTDMGSFCPNCEAHIAEAMEEEFVLPQDTYDGGQIQEP